SGPRCGSGSPCRRGPGETTVSSDLPADPRRGGNGPDGGRVGGRRGAAWGIPPVGTERRGTRGRRGRAIPAAPAAGGAGAHPLLRGRGAIFRPAPVFRRAGGDPTATRRGAG